MDKVKPGKVLVRFCTILVGIQLSFIGQVSAQPIADQFLFSWYSQGRTDNFATTDNRWRGKIGTRRLPDYRLYRIEGAIFSPDLPPPPDTVPLYSWYNPTTNDNFITSHPEWHPDENNVGPSPEYRFVRKEGYVISPSRTPPSGFVPIYSWYNSANGDNFATTDPRWVNRSDQPRSGYNFNRIEGYARQVSSRDIRNERLPEFVPSRDGDRDGDGLPDLWEEARSSWGLRTNQTDLIFVPVLRPDVPLSTYQAEIEKFKQFYKNIPIQNIFGSTGINIIQRAALRLPNRFRSDATPFLLPDLARNISVNANLRDYAHALFLEPPGSGGSAAGIWGSSGASAPEMIHEMGHMLMLPHEPGVNVKGQSPLHASLMNYDYTGSFNGSPNNIQFSPGHFSSLTLDERNLNETLRFSAEELSFLTYEPYAFDVQSLGRDVASVDFNRNGIHAEENITADINDGTSHSVGRDFKVIGKTESVVSMASVRDLLVIVTTEANVGGFPPHITNHDNIFPTSTKVIARVFNKEDTEVANFQNHLNSQDITPPNLTINGAPSLININDEIVMSIPVRTGLAIIKYALEDDRRFRVKNSFVTRDPISNPFLGFRDDVVLVNSGSDEYFYAVKRNHESKIVSVRRHFANGLQAGDWIQINIVSRNGSSRPMKSSFPIAATWNTKENQLLIASSGSMYAQRVYIYSAKWLEQSTNSSGLWSISGALNTGLNTKKRPSFVFDDNESSGENGRIFMFARQPNRTTYRPRRDNRHRISVAKITPMQNDEGALIDGGLRIRQFVNQWTHTQTALEITPYRDDFAIAWRHAANPGTRFSENNDVYLSFNASGEEYRGPADSNNLKVIAEQGLWRSLPINQ